MLSTSLSLRIVAIFATFAASLFGIALPLWATRDNKTETAYFKCMKACGAGVLLGIAMMHLLPEGHEDLESAFPDYPLAYALTCFGVVLVLFVEQSVMILNESQHAGAYSASPGTGPDSSPHSPNSEVEHNEDCGFVNCDCEDATGNGNGTTIKKECPECPVIETGIELAVISTSTNETIEKLGAHDHTHEHHTLGLSKLMNTNNLKDLVSIYTMEFSIAIHSIIIGVDIGLLSASSELVTLISLIIAISFHQFVEGFSLGSNLSSQSAHTLGHSKIITFVVIFAITVPIGIVIGICTSELEETDTDVIARGSANAIAAGTLLYISLAEMISEYFEAKDLKYQPTVKMFMLLSLALGTASMAVLANWA